MNKTTLIARVSDIEQRQALPAQKLRLQNYAHWLGATEFDYFEFDESAYKDSRQKFGKVIEQIEAEQANQIVVFDKIDRFTRDASQKEVRIMSSLVQKGRVELHFPSDNLTITKDSPATDLFRLGIGMLLAKYYSDASRDNVKRRLEQMRNDGICPQRVPLGYKHVSYLASPSSKPIKDIVVVPRLARQIVKVFELRSQGLSYQVIADEMSERGLRTPVANKPVSSSVIERMLAHKFYIGIMTCNGKEYPHKYPKIVSKELFGRCQLIKWERRPSEAKAKNNSRIYALKGIVGCGECGRSVSSYKARNSIYLKCANFKCKTFNTAEALVLPDIQKALKQLRMPARTAQAIRSSLKRQEAEQAAQISQIRQKITAVNNQLDLLYDDRLVGRITTEQHDRRATKLEDERQSLKKQSDFLTSTPDAIKKTVSQMIDLCQNAHKLFQNASNSIKNSVLEILLSNIELKNKRLTFSLNFPCWGSGEIGHITSKNENRSLWRAIWDSNPGHTD